MENRIVVLGDGLFVPELIRHGYDVVHLHPDSSTTPFPLERWTSVEISKHLLPGDVLLISGAISPVVFPSDCKEIASNPIVCYLPDAPLHRFWMSRAAPVLTLLVVDQPHEVSYYSKLGVPTEWLPLAADPTIYHPGERKWQDRDIDFLFVGTVDPIRRMKRSKLLSVVGKHCDVTVLDGGGTRSIPAQEVAEYYRRAKIVINENMFPSVNLRMFEAMACGAMLFTEETDRNWTQLFVDKKHLLSFNPSNLRERIDWIREYFDTKVRTIAETGMQEIAQNHLVANRVTQLLTLLHSLSPKQNEANELRFASAPLRMALRWNPHPQRENWLQGSIPLLTNETSEVDEEGWLDRAALLHTLQRSDDVLSMLTEAVTKIPHSLRLRLALAWQLIESDSSTGISHLRQAVRLAGLEHFESGRLRIEQGYRHYLSAIILTQIDCDFDPGFLWRKLPIFLWKAMEHFQRAVELSPDDEQIRFDFAQFLFDRFAIEEAGFLLDNAPIQTPAILAKLNEIALFRYS